MDPETACSHGYGARIDDPIPLIWTDSWGVVQSPHMACAARVQAPPAERSGEPSSPLAPRESNS